HPASPCQSLLVEVAQVAAAVGEDRVDAAVVPPLGFGDEPTPLALSRAASRWQSSVRSDSTGRLAAGLLEPPRWRVGLMQRQLDPVGSSGDTTVSQRSSGW